MPKGLAHNPDVLYAASIERKESAWRLLDDDPAMALYLSGLSVECILQAVALLEAAAVVHVKGVVAWTNYTRK